MLAQFLAAGLVQGLVVVPTGIATHHTAGKSSEINHRVKYFVYRFVIPLRIFIRILMGSFDDLHNPLASVTNDIVRTGLCDFGRELYLAEDLGRQQA